MILTIITALILFFVVYYFSEDFDLIPKATAEEKVENN